MAKRGPKPAPNHLKILRGTEERYINREEPIPAAVEGVMEPPEGLSEAAKVVWRRLAPDLADKGVLTPWDVQLFSAYCSSAAQYEDLRGRLGDQFTVEGSRRQPVRNPLWAQMLDALDRVMRLGALFGLSPADRARLHVKPGRDEPKLGPERLLNQ